MKKILIICLILSLLIAGAAGICIGILPSIEIIGASTMSDGRVCYLNRYGFGVFLNITDKNGENSSSSYLGSADSNYKSIIAGNEKIYVLSLRDNAVFVESYNANGAYIKCEYTQALDESSNYIASFTPNHYLDEAADMMVVDEIWLMLVKDKKQISANCIETPNSSEPRTYFLNDGDVTKAMYVANKLVYSDSFGEYHVIDNNGISKRLDFGDTIIPYNLFSFWFSFALIDLSDTSMKFGFIFEDADNDDDVRIFQDSVVISSDTALGGRVDFSELRNLSCDIHDKNLESAIGIGKTSDKRGYVCVFNIYSRSAVIYDEIGISLGSCIISAVFVFILSFLAELIILLIVRGLLAIRKMIIKQVLIMAIAVLLMFYPTEYAYRTLFTLVSTSFICNALGSSLEVLTSEIDGDYFAANGLTDEYRERLIYLENGKSKRKMNDWSNSAPFIDIFNFSLDYVEVTRLVDDNYRYEYYTSIKPGAVAEYFTDNDRLEKYKVADSESYIATRSTLFGKKWVELTSFLTDGAGKQVGFIQIGFNEDRISRDFERVAFFTACFALFPAILVMIFFSLTLNRLLRPLKALKKGVSEVAQGKVGTTVVLKSNDEFQDIGNSFNEMSVKLDKYFNSINVISKAYEKYLPRDFFKLMGKTNVLDIKPSDRVKIPLAYVFVSIHRGENTDNSNLSFDKLGSLFTSINEIISTRGGVVEAFNDSHITVIFTSSVNDAVDTALSLSESFSGGAFTLSFTVQKTESVLGVVGDDTALATIAVSSAIALQDRIDELTEKLKISFVITESAIKELDETKLLCRKIGRISDFIENVAAECDTTLYENYDAYTYEEKRKKELTISDFDEMVYAFGSGNLRAARSLAINILRIDRDDAVTRCYLLKINERIAENENS